jgi:uncharacterized protein (DUF362 family)
MKRREYLKSLVVTGAAVATGNGLGADVFAQEAKSDEKCDLVAVMGGEPDEMFNRAIAAFGGMSRFVKKGQKVVVKPNIGWDKKPEFAGNTNPTLVKTMVKACLDAGASEVVVFDNTCDSWRKCYENSGIEAAVLEVGGKVVPGNDERFYKEVELPKGKSLKKAKIHEVLLACDVWFNVPILKHHGGTHMTISMKNYMGIVWDRRVFHSTELQQCIADICTHTKRPALNIVDAYRVLKSNGPKGRSEADAVVTKALFASPDIVAVDTASAKFFSQIANIPLESVGHIAKAQELELGTMDIDKLNVRRIRI